jgi:hypothetical protein
VSRTTLTLPSASVLESSDGSFIEEKSGIEQAATPSASAVGMMTRNQLTIVEPAAWIKPNPHVPYS